MLNKHSVTSFLQENCCFSFQLTKINFYKLNKYDKNISFLMHSYGNSHLNCRYILFHLRYHPSTF